MATRKSKQTNKTLQNSIKEDMEKEKNLSVSEKEFFQAHFFFNIIRLETEIVRSLKKFRLIEIQKETNFSHKMKGISTVYELIWVVLCRKLFQIYCLEGFLLQICQVLLVSHPDLCYHCFSGFSSASLFLSKGVMATTKHRIK